MNFINLIKYMYIGKYAFLVGFEQNIDTGYVYVENLRFTIFNHMYISQMSKIP